MVINQEKPAVLAVKRGDASALRSTITAVLMLVSPYTSD
jgi:tRNA threonylcarbamoyladenosine modification (KEOPS) complex  Pcc1 subunit